VFFLKRAGFGDDGRNVHICEVNPDGSIGDLTHSYKWTEGWSSVAFYVIGAATYLVLLRSAGFGSDGDNVHIHRMNADGAVGERVDSHQWTEGWTQAIPFVVNGASFLFLLKASGYASDGNNVHITKLSGTGVGEVVWRDRWTEGWTTGAFYVVDGVTYLLILKRFGVARNGDNAHFYRMLGNGAVDIQHRVDTRLWTEGWTQARPFAVAERKFMLFLKEQGLGDDGTNARVYELTGQGGRLGERVYAATWSEGWTTCEFFEQAGATRLLLLKHMLAPGTFDASFTSDEPFDASVTNDEPFDASFTDDEPFDPSLT
jgi:hypothetical protein